MKILGKQPTVKAPAETFTGDAWYDVIAKGEHPSSMRVNVVRFTPGARNAWHCHAVGQTLHVTEGHGLIQARGGKVIEIGDTIWTPPGEWHWHSAAPEHFMTHLAMWEAPADDSPETEWGHHLRRRHPGRPRGYRRGLPREIQPLRARHRLLRGRGQSRPGDDSPATSVRLTAGRRVNRPQTGGHN